MMNLAEKNIVIDFLKKKKLSYPVYKEVLDHFFIDIERNMNENVGFQEAFLQTKIKWQNEFQMVNPDPLSFRKIPKIEADLIGNRFRNILKISLLAAVVALLFFMIRKAAFAVIMVGLSLGFLALLVYSFATRKISLFNYIMLSFHPLILRGILASIVISVASTFFEASFSSSQMNYKEALTLAVMVFNITVQIQLLLFHNRKINVLMS